jgi:hypothetical protein
MNQRLNQNIKNSKLLVDSLVQALDSEDDAKQYAVKLGFALNPIGGKSLNQVKTVLNKFRAALANFSEDLVLGDLVLAVVEDTMEFDKRLTQNTHNIMAEKAGLKKDDTAKEEEEEATPEPPEAA